MNPIKNYLIDMDGVLVRGRTILAGADAFIERLKAQGAKYLVFTNESRHTPEDLAHRLQTLGLDIPEGLIFTSAMATAFFLESQKPKARAFVIGERGLTKALRDMGCVITDRDPDFVVLGETHAYDIEEITRAGRLILGGAHFVATNPDPSDPSESGLVPACGALAALIETVTGRSPYFVGKPNPLMMRKALNYLGVHSENTVMIGDRMDTDIRAGVESGMETILVLSGVTRPEDLPRFPYRPTRVVESVAQIDP